MQEPLPQLIDLIIDRSDKMKRIPDQIPDSFLGGSAPRLLPTTSPVMGHFIPRTTGTTVIYYAPRHSLPLENPSFRIHFT